MVIDLEAANHTNRELELMLGGKKSLAWFYDEISVLPWEEIIPEQQFKPYVDSGVFVRDEALLEGQYLPKLGRNAVIKHVLFAVTEEAWRIPAFLLVQRVYARTGRYTEQIGRLVGELLGYTAEEVDAWCDHEFRNPARVAAGDDS